MKTIQIMLAFVLLTSVSYAAVPYNFDTGEVISAQKMNENFSNLDSKISRIPQGLKGDTGEPGAQGILGPKGNKGEIGSQGTQGIAGSKGDKGDTGHQGSQGVAGDQGPQGIKGDTGIRGYQGVQGDKGDTGPQGIAGAKGNKGDAGEQGVQGIPGTAGSTGIQVYDANDNYIGIFLGLDTSYPSVFQRHLNIFVPSVSAILQLNQTDLSSIENGIGGWVYLQEDCQGIAYGLSPTSAGLLLYSSNTKSYWTIPYSKSETKKWISRKIGDYECQNNNDTHTADFVPIQEHTVEEVGFTLPLSLPLRFEVQ